MITSKTIKLSLAAALVTSVFAASTAVACSCCEGMCPMDQAKKAQNGANDSDESKQYADCRKAAAEKQFQIFLSQLEASGG